MPGLFVLLAAKRTIKNDFKKNINQQLKVENSRYCNLSLRICNPKLPSVRFFDPKELTGLNPDLNFFGLTSFSSLRLVIVQVNLTLLSLAASVINPKERKRDEKPRHIDTC